MPLKMQIFISHFLFRRQPAEFFFSKNIRVLKKTYLLFQVTLEHNSNSTNSVLKFVPNIGDAGKFLKCRAENIEMTASQLEDSRSLEINCKAHNISHTIHNPQKTQILFREAPVAALIPTLIFFLHFVEDKLISLR